MNNLNPQPTRQPGEKRFGCLQVTILLLIGMALAAAMTFFVLKRYIFPSEFAPTTLNDQEERILEKKLDWLDKLGFKDVQVTDKEIEIREGQEVLEPEPYSEESARREIDFTEKELNAMLAKNTDLARKVAIDLSDDLVSAKILVPVDPDFPILGGKTLRVRAGLNLAYRMGRPIVMLKGISIMGVPIPNAWLGGLKNVDLVEEFGTDAGFWKSFAAGVEYLEVRDGRLHLKLKE